MENEQTVPRPTEKQSTPHDVTPKTKEAKTADRKPPKTADRPTDAGPYQSAGFLQARLLRLRRQREQLDGTIEGLETRLREVERDAG